MATRKRILPIRILFALFGILCVGVGFVGLVTPGLPGFVFFLIALWSFRNSSSRLETWLLNNRMIGPTLRDWEETRSMKRSTKIIAISAIWLAILATCTRIWTKLGSQDTIELPFLERFFRQQDGKRFHYYYVALENPKLIAIIPIAVLQLTAVLLTIYLSRIKTKSSPASE
jgi:hypothetical protein